MRPDPAAERLLNDFVFADRRLGSHSGPNALVLWADGNTLVASESAPPSWVQPGVRIPRMSVTEHALRVQCPVLVSDVRQSVDYFQLVHDTRSELAVPLFDDSRTVGVLNLESPQVDFFTDQHLHSACLLALLLVYVRRHVRDGRSTPSARALGEAMRQVRRSVSTTQERLAARLGITRIALSRQESGAQAPSSAQLYKWCDSLHLVTSTTAARVELIDITQRIQAVLQDPSRLAQLTPDLFERFVAERLDRMGYDVTLTGGATSRDGGIDLIAVPKVRTFASFLLAGQVKHHATGRKTGRAAVDRLLAWKDSPFRMGLLVTNTAFSRDARWVAELEQNRPFLRLRDFEDLKHWIENDFSSDTNWREIPDELELAPGVTIRVPRPTLTRLDSVWTEPVRLTALAPKGKR